MLKKLNKKELQFIKDFKKDVIKTKGRCIIVRIVKQNKSITKMEFAYINKHFKFIKLNNHINKISGFRPSDDGMLKMYIGETVDFITQGVKKTYFAIPIYNLLKIFYSKIGIKSNEEFADNYYEIFSNKKGEKCQKN